MAEQKRIPCPGCATRKRLSIDNERWRPCEMCGSVRDGTIPDRRAPSAAEHCQDCCCARSWKALGVTDSKGLSIPEHIMAMRSEIERERIGARKTFDEFYATIKALRAEVNALHIRVRDLVLDGVTLAEEGARLQAELAKYKAPLTDEQRRKVAARLHYDFVPMEIDDIDAAIRAAREGER